VGSGTWEGTKKERSKITNLPEVTLYLVYVFSVFFAREKFLSARRFIVLSILVFTEAVIMIMIMVVIVIVLFSRMRA
jgi:hypothetical protein